MNVLLKFCIPACLMISVAPSVLLGARSLSSSLDPSSDGLKNALFEAIQDQDIGAVAQLCRNVEVNPNVRDCFGLSPLLYAVNDGNLAIAKILLTEGVRTDVDAQDFRGRTPLMIAAAYGNVEMVNLLLRKGADVHMEDINGETPLSYALCNDENDDENFPIVLLFLKSGKVTLEEVLLCAQDLGKVDLVSRLLRLKRE